MAHTTKTTTTRSAKSTPEKKPARSATTTRNRQPRTARAEIEPGIRHRMIAEAAYLKAEQRGFSSGDPLDDWLTAEREIDMLLAGATQVTQ